MRLFRIILYTLINLVLFLFFQKWYEVLYYYYFGEKVFIPTLVLPYIFIPIFIFQVVYQIILIYELIFKKFVTKKLNFVFVIPILLTLIIFSKTPFSFFKEYQSPELKIEQTISKIAMELEKYRVKTFFYPKDEKRFREKILSKISKDNFITEYKTKRKNVKLKVYYLFDSSVYTNNVKKFDSPSVIVVISGDGKHFWITSLVPMGYINKQEQFLRKDGGVLIIEDDIMIRKKLRDKLKHNSKELTNPFKR